MSRPPVSARDVAAALSRWLRVFVWGGEMCVSVWCVGASRAGAARGVACREEVLHTGRAVAMETFVPAAARPPSPAALPPPPPPISRCPRGAGGNRPPARAGPWRGAEEKGRLPPSAAGGMAGSLRRAVVLGQVSFSEVVKGREN